MLQPAPRQTTREIRLRQSPGDAPASEASIRAQIEFRAYEGLLACGDDQADWFKAERELNGSRPVIPKSHVLINHPSSCSLFTNR